MALCDEGDERKPAAEGRPLRVKEFVGGKNNGSPFCFRHRTALLRSWELLSYPGAQKRNAPSPSDIGRVTFMISRHGQSDIYDLTFSMGYPARSAGYMFCYNRSMIHLASVFSGGFFGREEEDFDLTQGDFCIMVGLPLLSGVVAPIHWRYRSRYQKWTLTGQNSCQRWVRKVSGSCQKSARSGETLL